MGRELPLKEGDPSDTIAGPSDILTAFELAVIAAATVLHGHDFGSRELGISRRSAKLGGKVIQAFQ